MKKLGTYIENLMTIIVDKEQEQFVKELARNELTNVKNDIDHFLIQNKVDDSERVEKTEKILLQEEK